MPIDQIAWPSRRRAYDYMLGDREEGKLLERYEKILESELRISRTAMTELATSFNREQQMSLLVMKRLRTIDDAWWRFRLRGTTVEIKAQADRLAKAALFARDFVSSRVSTDPHVALALAGVCMLLPLLLDPTSQQKALVEVIDYTSTLIIRFTAIQRIYYQQNPRRRALSGIEEVDELHRSFEGHVTKLYAQILSYQAQAVCQLLRPDYVRYGRDVLNIENWTTLLSEFKTTESECCELSQVVDADRLDTAFKEQSSRIEELLRSQKQHYQILDGTMALIPADLRHQKKEQANLHRTKEENRCLQALCTSTYQDHKNLNNPDRVPGTCQWFLRNEKFHAWSKKESSGILWVTADPGCGKSVLSKSLIDLEFRNTPLSTTCYFFFKENSADQRSAVNALCALLHQLCSRNQVLLQIAVASYRSNGSQLTTSITWLWELFVRIVECPEAGEIICVLDALDECEEKEREDLIDALNGFYTSQNWSDCQLKFLITSRPYYEIEERFDQVTIRLAGEDESETIKREIDLVIRDSVSRIAAKKSFDQKTQNALEERLLRTENRTYLWLYLTLAGIEKGLGISTPKKMAAFIDQIPNSVYETYESILDHSPRPELARRLLHIIVAAVRPLTLTELNMAMNLEDDQKSRANVDLDPEETFQSHIRNLCGLFVTVQSSRVYLLHQTAKEFLVSKRIDGQSATCMISETGRWRHSFEPSESHLVLARSCLRYLSFTVAGDKSLTILGAEKKQSWQEQISSQISLHQFLTYSAENWGLHHRLAREDQDSSKLWRYVCETQSGRFTSWFGHHWKGRPFSVDYNRKLLRGVASLILGCKFGYEVMAESLVKFDEEVNNDTLWSPLHWAAEGGHETLVMILLPGGCPVDPLDDEGRTPLWFAAYRGHDGVCKFLIQWGACLNTKDKWGGRTPVAVAAEGHKDEVIRTLIDAGAVEDYSSHSNTGGPPPWWAAITGVNRRKQANLDKQVVLPEDEWPSLQTNAERLGLPFGYNKDRNSDQTHTPAVAAIEAQDNPRLEYIRLQFPESKDLCAKVAPSDRLDREDVIQANFERDEVLTPLVARIGGMSTAGEREYVIRYRAEIDRIRSRNPTDLTLEHREMEAAYLEGVETRLDLVDRIKEYDISDLPPLHRMNSDLQDIVKATRGHSRGNVDGFRTIRAGERISSAHSPFLSAIASC